MKIAIVIPARYESSRFPGKPLIDILGKSLIERVWERCCLAISLENVYVATDDSRIEEHCKAKGIQTIMTSLSCLTGTDRVYEASKKINADLFVNVQGDEALINPNDIINCIKTYKREPGFVYCGMCDITNAKDFFDTTVPKVVVDPDNTCIYMSRAGVPTTKKLEFVEGKRQVCIYVFPPEALKAFGECTHKGRVEALEDIELLRFFDLGYKIKMVDVSFSECAVDTPEDVERLISILKKNNASS